MKKKTAAILALLCLAVLLAAAGEAQSPTRAFPDVATPSTAQSIAVYGWATTVQTYLAQDGTDIQNLQIAVTDPSSGLQALQSQINDLRAQLTATQGTAPPPPTTNQDLTGLPIGPLSGIVANIQWNTGQWNATAQGVQPAVQGASRNFVLPSGTTMTSVTIECLAQNCQMKFADSAGETVTSPVLSPGNITVLSTGYTKASGAVVVSMLADSALDVRLLAIAYK